MNTILKIENGMVLIGNDRGQSIMLPLSCADYPRPAPGDTVFLYRGGDRIIISPAHRPVYAPDPRSAYPSGTSFINKHIFTWIGAFLFGTIGVDRFMRGQILLGLLKLFTCGALGIWYLADLIIALVRSYGSASAGSDDIAFFRGRYLRPAAPHI